MSVFLLDGKAILPHSWRVSKLERWRERAEAALEGALKERDAESEEGPVLAAALRRIGELSMENGLLRAKMGQSPGPLARRRWWLMAGSVSPATGRRYGVARVCKVRDVPRSSFYLTRRAAQDPAPARAKGRRGPKPAVSDADLLAAIRADLARAPWSGAGHRKVWARLRVQDGLCVARKRVLAADAREHSLLSPHRARPRPAGDHDRTIVTGAPNVMWATDGTQIATVQDGKVRLFATVEHWNAEALGWHVGKRGRRHEARAGPWAWPCASNTATSAATPRAACSSTTITAAASWPRTSRPRSEPGG